MNHEAGETTQRNEIDLKSPSEQEYASLRQAILQWQNFRFVLLGASIALVTAIFNIKDTNVPWQLISSFILFFLSISVYLTGYASRGNMQLSTYIEVFYENTQENKYGWESRQAIFRLRSPGTEILRLNYVLYLTYISLSVVSLVAPFFQYDKNLTNLSSLFYRVIDKFKSVFDDPLSFSNIGIENIILSGSILLFYLSFALAKQNPIRADYINQWKEVIGMPVQDPEAKTNQENTFAVLGVGIAGAIAVVSSGGFFDLWDAAVGATLLLIISAYPNPEADVRISRAYSAVWSLSAFLALACLIDYLIIVQANLLPEGPFSWRGAAGIGVCTLLYGGHRLWSNRKLKKKDRIQNPPAPCASA